MKLAITASGDTLESTIDPRFGRAKYVIQYDTDSGSVISVFENTYANAEHGAGTGLVGWLTNQQVDGVIASQYGPKALDILKEAGTALWVAPSDLSIEQAIEKHKSNQLKKAV